MMRCQRIPLTEVRNIFIFPHLFMSVSLRTFLSVLPVYVHYMYISLLSLLLDGILYVLVFVCVCCAAPDKLTSLPPFTGLGALHYGIRVLGSKPVAWGDA